MAPVVTKMPAPRMEPTPVAVRWTGPSARRRRPSPSCCASASSVRNGLRANRPCAMGCLGRLRTVVGSLARETGRREARAARARRLLGPRRGRQRDHAQRAAAAADELERGGDDDRAGRRQLVEVAQARQAEAAGAVHQGMTRERRVEGEGLAGVGADGLDADPEDVALVRQQLDRAAMEAGAVRTVGGDVEEVSIAVTPETPEISASAPAAA